MAKFVFSAFADEIDADFDIQLESLKKLNIGLLELRIVDGKSFAELSDLEVLSVKEKLKKAGIGLSALGTPIGKIDVDGDFEGHKMLFSRIMDIGDALGCKKLRVFSFYPGKDMSHEVFRERAFLMLGELLDMSEKRGFVLCHENEKDIFGCDVDRELEMLEHFGGRLRAVLDPGNFAFCGADASQAYNKLKDYIDYFHIKDADPDGNIVPPGKGVAFLFEHLRDVAADRPDSEIVITMEPHLMIFAGLSTLSKLDDIKHVYHFDSPLEAFSTATESVRKMVASLE